MSRALATSTASAPDLDAALRALADGNRRRILALVRDQAGAVGEIAEGVALSQQAVSHHLRVLRGAGLVTEQREGTRHLFRVRTDGLRVVEEFLDGFWHSPCRAEARRRGRIPPQASRGGPGWLTTQPR
jgi:DNA-binding transcriptional ArsR family regulator